MGQAFYILTVEQDWRWTLAALAVCAIGSGAAFRLLTLSRGLRPGPRRRRLILAGAFVGGVSIFATHFMALQGHPAAEFMRYGLGLTLASFAVGLGGITIASLLLVGGTSRLNRGMAALLGLITVAGMHFLGVSALDVPGEMIWNPATLCISTLAAVLLGGLTGGLVYGAGPWRFGATVVTGSVAVLFMHFGAMPTIVITPGEAADATVALSATAMMSIIVATVLALIAIAALILFAGLHSRSAALKQMREAVDAMSDGMAVYDADDRLVLWNNRFAELTKGMPSPLVAGMEFREILQMAVDAGVYQDIKGREAEFVAERLVQRRGLATTMEEIGPDGRWFRVSDRRTAEGGVVTICTDISELKEDARALAEARDAAQAASVAKSQFLANMSHEIRTPLNGVIGVTQALAQTDLTFQQREMMELIQSSGRTLQVLLSDILDLARVESGRLELADEAFDLGRTVREAAALYQAVAREKGLDLFVEVDPAVDGWIHGDVVRVKQILTNLVSNAVKFTTDGFVGLRVAPGPATAAGATLRFSVEDTGIGFDCETRERLFSRFEQADGAITRKFGGSGLGLAISRQLAEMMGGELDCESEPGGGSAFLLTIPHRPAEVPRQAEATMETSTDRGASVKVLLADDHPVNRKVVEMILAQAPVELTSVEDGVQALQAVRQTDFDLILMDMQMPVMDGLTATREIRLHEAAMGLTRTPIVMLTANALAEHIEAGQAAGCDHHLAKPFDAADLLALVGEAASSPRALARAA